MTFVRIVFLWTGAIVWYVALVLLLARGLHVLAWRNMRADYPPVHDVEDDSWVHVVDDEDDGWNGWSKWPGGAA